MFSEKSTKAVNDNLPKERAEFLARDFQQGFIDYCGIRAATVARGFFESRVPLEPRHRQQDGFAHAGIMAAMADHTAGYAAFTVVPEDFQILTIEFKINFLKPARGTHLICRSRIIRPGRQIIIAESEIFARQKDTSEACVAKAMVTLMAVHQDKLRGAGKKGQP